MRKDNAQRVATAARLWLMEGQSHDEIAKRLGVTRVTVWRWSQSEVWAEEVARLNDRDRLAGDKVAIAIDNRIGGMVDRAQARQIIGSMLEKRLDQMQRIEQIQGMILDLIELGTTDATMAAQRLNPDGTGGLFALMARYGKDTLPMVRLLGELQASSSACLADGLQFDRFMEWLDAQEQIAD